MPHRTTNVTQRIDMLIAQAERFAQVAGMEEAAARARQVIAYCALELEKERDPMLRDELEQRMLLAERLLNRLGYRVRDRRGQLTVHAEDADVPETWD